jgi:hypothetical protein
MFVVEAGMLRKEVDGMSLAIGLIIVAATCLVGVWIVRIAGSSIRNFDESKHESFRGE